jgi:hypothetical protein
LPFAIRYSRPSRTNSLPDDRRTVESQPSLPKTPVGSGRNVADRRTGLVENLPRFYRRMQDVRHCDSLEMAHRESNPGPTN